MQLPSPKKLNAREVLSVNDEASLFADITSRERVAWLAVVKDFYSNLRASKQVRATLRDGRPYICFQVLGSAFTGLLDTGSHVSILGNNFHLHFLKLGLNLSKLDKNFALTSATGHSVICEFKISVPVELGKIKRVFNFVVMPDIKSNIILGCDFWKNFNICPKVSKLMNSNETVNKNCVDEVVGLDNLQNLSSSQRLVLDEVIQEYNSFSSDRLGRTFLEQHVIDTGDCAPIKQRVYPISHHLLPEAHKELDRLLDLGVVEPSNSSWNNPIVLVPKKNGAFRLCLDSRRINSISKRDAYSLPLISDILNSLGGARYLTTLDLNDAFFQIPLEESSKEKTAFTIPKRGLFHFVTMPFGLHGASARMMRLMDKVLGPEFDGKVFCYLDDIIIISASFEEHIELLRRVKQKLLNAGLTINVKKSIFCRDSLKYLGFVIDSKGLRTDPDKVKAIVDFPIPTSQKSLRRFIGILSWYKRFILNFSLIAAPLHNLTKKDFAGKRFVWNEKAQSAFSHLKNILVNAPVLSCPDFNKPFTISCDASNTGLGAVLSQTDDNGKEHPISFISRTLSAQEKNHSTTEKELNAMIFALEKFRGYIEGSPIPVKIITDHYSLKWLTNLKSPSGRLARWAVRLQQFNFEIIHRNGKDNIVPDALSRDPLQVDLIEQSFSTSDKWYINLREKILANPGKFPAWKVESGVIHKHIQSMDALHKSYDWKEVLPKECRMNVIRQHHVPPTCAHFGILKTVNRISLKYYWPRMAADVKYFIGKCQICLGYKSTNLLPPGLMGDPKLVQRPWQMIATDLLGPYPNSYKKGYTYLLVVSDFFSKYTRLFPLRKATGSNIALILENEIFLKFGVPDTIILDNGPQYISRDMKALADKFHIRHLFYNCRYHPQNNPVERVNKVLVAALGSYVGSEHRTWANFLPEIELAINTAIHEVTGYTPFFLNFGREIIVSGNEYKGSDFNAEDIKFAARDTWASDLQELNDIFSQVRTSLRQSYERNKIQYNLRRRDVQFDIGNIVWRRSFVLSDASKHFSAKLAPKFLRSKVIGKISPVAYRLSDMNDKPVGTFHIKDIIKLEHSS